MQVEEQFSISTRRVHGCVVVAVTGELDAVNAEPLEQTLTRCQNGHPVVVDLEAVTFICSASLHVLLKQRPGGRPVLVRPNRNVAKVLDIIEAGRTTSIFQDLEGAVASLDMLQQVAS